MSLERDCSGCAFGLHEKHNPTEGQIPGLIGGTTCSCTGDCQERARDRAQHVLARLVNAQPIVLHIVPDPPGTVQPEVPSFICLVCGATSYSPADVREGYCGRCHTFTDRPT